jgi:hypothetical protein
MTEDPTPYTTNTRPVWNYGTNNLRQVASSRLNIPEEQCGWPEIATLLRQSDDRDLLRYRGIGPVTLAKLRKDLSAPYMDEIHGREIRIRRKKQMFGVRVRPAEPAPDGGERWVVDLPKGLSIDDVIR